MHAGSEKELKQQQIQKGGDPSLFELYMFYPGVRSGIPVISAWLKRKRYLEALEKLFEQICKERGKPDLIHCNVAIPAGLGALHLAMKYGISFVLNEGWTGYMEEDGSYKGWITKWLTRRIVGKASQILPVSEDLKKSMLAHGLQGKYSVIPNVIQTDIFVSEHKVNPEKIRFIHVSTFDPKQKNVKGIINAFQTALLEKPGMELLLVGESEYKAELKTQVEKMRLEGQIHFLGFKTSEELSELFQKSTALLMFSNYESFGVVIGEALSCGLPVICSKAGGLSSLLSDQEAILVQKGDEAELSKAILKMAETQEKYSKLKLRNFVVDRFSEARVGEQLNKVYREAIEKKHAE